MDKHMLIMLVIMGICLVFAHTGDSKVLRRQCVVCVTIVMTLFSGLRSWWFGDLIKYYTLYRNCNAVGGWNIVFEEFSNVGIRLFFRIAGTVGVSYDICIFLIALFSAATLGLLVFKYSPAPYWSYLMYIAMGFFSFTYSGLKQTIAMGFLMLAAIAMFEGKLKAFIGWTLIATIFHTPACIFLPAYMVARQRFTQKHMIFLIVLALCIFLFRNQIVSFAAKAYYDTEGKYSADGQIGGRTLMMLFILFVAAILRPVQTKDKIYCQTFNLMVIAAMIQYFGMYDNVFTRLADYYYQFVILFMPLMMETGTHQALANPNYMIKKNDKTIYNLLSVGITLFALWFYNNMLEGSTILRTYRFFWEIDPYWMYGTG